MVRNVSLDLQEKLDTLPTKPGVYLMKDEGGRILYVGKAINLRARVRSYFHASASHSPKVERLVAHIADIDFIVTASELEALILESNLIKRHKPRYNVRLKDDKRYPYIKVTWQEDFPKILIVRRMEQDGARYFGPFTASWAVQQTLHTLRRVFPYLTCNRTITGQDERACLYWDLGLCLAPCIGEADREEYRAMIDGLCRFLEGKSDQIVADLEARMATASEAWDFEQAAAYRDQLAAIQRVIEHQKIVSPAMADQDVIAFARADGDACVQVFFIRHGRLIGREYFVLDGTAEESEAEVVASFVKQFYDEAAYVPPEILLPHEIDEAIVIQDWLRRRRGEKVVLKVPRRGHKRDLVEMATENAAETLSHLRAQWLLDEGRQTTALSELQKHLDLETAPNRIECYDISTMQGRATTGSMVVFVKGVPRKSDYRRFKIRTVEGTDDYGSMREMLRRRFRRVVEPEPQSAQGPGTKKGTWDLLPDLLVVDGGRGQLNVALEVLDEFGLRDQVPAIGLAKQEEEVFVPERAAPLRLPRTSEGLYLLQRVRDEAHRFAISYHRGLRRKQTIRSQLDDVPGIGPKRRSALLKHFGSLDAIRAADVEALAAVPGMTRKAAEQVKEFL
ncbi:MAG: excinuclease ABC subunit UvrC [Anaerolineae bacterium]|jgi:excinuclease ABC subunit C